MARTLTADLLTAQTTGYPTGGYAPAVRCIFTSEDGGTTHDYSFNPTFITAGSFVVGASYIIITVGTTNFTLIGAASNTIGVFFTATGVGSGTGTAIATRLIHVQQIEERENDWGVIRLTNHDRAVPADLTGYYVDLGWGHNTASGVLYAEANGAVSPRLWVMSQHNISGGLKGTQPHLYTDFAMAGVWGAVLNKQPVLVKSYPVRDIDIHRHDENYWMLSLMNKTIYEVLEQLIENELSAQTGLTFTLDALGTQDDGQISTVIPFPTELEEAPRFINTGSPWYFQTYGELITSLLELTKCILIPRAGLAFKIIYPQASDTVDETYYSSNADGHPFYEVENRRLNMVPNHIEVFGGLDEIYGIPTVSGHWFDTDHYSAWVTPDETATYDGPFMPVVASGSTDNELWELKLDTAEKCIVRAAQLGWQLKDQIRGTRVLIPMDARIELYDRVAIYDTRGT